jgi:hypothetical protein
VPPRRIFKDQRDRSHRGQVRAVRRIFNKSPGLLGLHVVWHCHDETAHLLPAGLYDFCELNPEASTELHDRMQNSHFHQASKNGLRVLPENPKTR